MLPRPVFSEEHELFRDQVRRFLADAWRKRRDGLPATPLEIMAGKIWSMALVVLVACTLSLLLVVKGLLAVPIEGSLALFLAGAFLG